MVIFGGDPTMPAILEILLCFCLHAVPLCHALLHTRAHLHTHALHAWPSLLRCLLPATFSNSHMAFSYNSLLPAHCTLFTSTGGLCFLIPTQHTTTACPALHLAVPSHCAPYTHICCCCIPSYTLSLLFRHVILHHCLFSLCVSTDSAPHY